MKPGSGHPSRIENRQEGQRGQDVRLWPQREIRELDQKQFQSQTAAPEFQEGIPARRKLAETNIYSVVLYF